jgi:hypothetical protein
MYSNSVGVPTRLSHQKQVILIMSLMTCDWLIVIVTLKRYHAEFSSIPTSTISSNECVVSSESTECVCVCLTFALIAET